MGSGEHAFIVGCERAMRHRADGAARGGKGLRRAGGPLTRRRAASGAGVRRSDAPRTRTAAARAGFWCHTARCARCVPTSSSSARAWAAARPRSRSPAAASTCSCSSAGERLPREPENWSPRRGVHRTPLQARRALARRRRPGLRARGPLRGRRQHEGLRREPARASASATSSAVEHHEGTSPAWPFRYADLEPYYGEAERIYRVHGTTGDDPTEPWRSTPFPYPGAAARALRRRPGGAAARAGRAARRSNAMGVDLRPGGRCIRCATCDGFPCPLGAKSDAETCAHRPGARHGARAPGDRRPGAPARHRRRAAAASYRLLAEGRTAR